MGQVRALARYRYRRFVNRIRRNTTVMRAVLVAIGLLVLPVAGYVLSPDTFGPQRVRAGVVHWGGWSLETAFYLACLMATVQSYRLLESLFRHPEARILATYPIQLKGLFWFRLGAALLDTLVVAAGCGLFLLPVWIKGGGLYYLWSLVLLLLSVLLVVAVGFATQMAAGVADYKHLPEFVAQLDRQSGGTGGAAAAYLFSPAIALGASLFLILFAKLSLEEILKATHQRVIGGLSGIVPAAGVILVLAIFGSIYWAYRTFTRHYPLLFARFFESDLIVLDVGFDYFARDRKPARGWEAHLSGPVRSLYRLDRLQLARRSPLARLMVFAGPFFGLVVFLVFGDRMSPWMVLTIGLLWVLVLANPWSRLYHPDMDPGMGAVVPVTAHTRQTARTYLVVREIGILTVPLALVGFALPSWDIRLTLWLVLLLSLALIPVFSALAQGSHRTPRVVGLLVTAVFAGLARLSSWGPFFGMVLVALAGVLWTRATVRGSRTGSAIPTGGEQP